MLEVEYIPFTPLMRASMDSSLLVASISTTRDEVPGMLKRTVKPGNVRDGFSLTGSIGTKAKTTVQTDKGDDEGKRGKAFHFS